MAGKRIIQKSHSKLKLASSIILLSAAGLLLMMPLTGSADAGSVSPADTVPEEPEVIVPWGERMPSVSAMDAFLPDYPDNPTVVPLSTPVEDTYFSDAAFLGDSRTEGFKLYSGLKEGSYFYAVGATVDTVLSRPARKTANGKISLLDAMSKTTPSKIYVMLGVNELGWTRIDLFHTHYAKVVERIRSDHPDAEIVLQSILPVSAEQDAKKTYVNNRRINEYNQAIQALAEEQQCHYLNVAEAVTDADGCLPANLSFDGVHLNRAGCAIWLDYLKTHSV